jgi:hypothetical protein
VSEETISELGNALFAYLLSYFGERNACRILVGKQERKRPSGRTRQMSVDNTKIDLREIGLGGMD